MKYAALVASLALTGCASMSGDSGKQLTDALQAMASDPNCGHTDRVQGDIGGLGSGLHVFLERTCPARPSPGS
jgi:hypothetical protein